MLVKQFLPCNRDRNLYELLDDLKNLGQENPISPFDPLVLTFFAELSSSLLLHPQARERPEIMALAYWMRKSQLRLLEKRFLSLSSNEVHLFPHGLVFHVPPANVDTIFIYSWLLAALAGNRSIIRISSRSSETVSLLLDSLEHLLSQGKYACLKSSLCCIGYGHDPKITEAISARCDLRIVWGGDETVAAIRKIPLSPFGRELTFPNRFSFSIIGVEEYLAASERVRAELALAFFNDAYWFDQMACSSPRLVVWRGPASGAATASRVFFDCLHHVILEKGYKVDAGTALDKLDLAYKEILDSPVESVQFWESDIVVLDLFELADIRDGHVGAGVFYQYVCQNVLDLLPFIDRRDQTMSYFGISLPELSLLADKLNGRGIDRIVPVGQSLQFHQFWDGYDLLGSMLRLVHLV